MEQKSFGKFLISLEALFLHLFFGGIIFAWSIELWRGNLESNVEVWIICWFYLAYSFCLWSVWRCGSAAAARKTSEQNNGTAVSEKAQKQQRKDRIACNLVSCFYLVYFFFRGRRWVIPDSFESQTLGDILFTISMSGLIGINVMSWGLFGLRKDEPLPTQPEEQLNPPE